MVGAVWFQVPFRAVCQVGPHCIGVIQAKAIQGFPTPMGAKDSLVTTLNVFSMVLVATVAGGFIDPVLHHASLANVVTADAAWPIRVVPGDVVEDNDSASRPALYFALEPPLVVMVTDQQAWRYLELHVTVRARSQDAIAAVKRFEPAITSRLLDLLYGRELRSFQGAEGIETLRRECLQEAQRVLSRESGAPGIDDLYFANTFFQ